MGPKDNLRYASAVCLYDYPDHKKTTTTPCDLTSACAPLQGALEYGKLNPDNRTEYGYCQADDGVLNGANMEDCVTCLQSSSSTYLANCERFPSFRHLYRPLIHPQSSVPSKPGVKNSRPQGRP